MNRQAVAAIFCVVMLGGLMLGLLVCGTERQAGAHVLDDGRYQEGYDFGHDEVTAGWARMREEGVDPEVRRLVRTMYRSFVSLDDAEIHESRVESRGDPQWARGYRAGVQQALSEVDDEG